NELLGKGTGAGKGHYDKRVIVKTGKKPPISCIIDGIQFTSGCTLGKGNIEVLNDQLAEAIFILGEKKLSIKLKIEIETRNRDLEESAMELYERPPEELFEIAKKF
ncbi:MAG: FmdE family protein, partial [Candidatus Helarchaeota archaeon]